MKLEGAIAVVTGAAQGLGLAIATHLAQAGATVVAADRDEAALARLPAPLQPCRLDVTDAAQVKAAAEAIAQQHGRIDILVNNAGVIMSEPFVNMMNPASLMHDLGRFEDCIRVNMTSVFIVTSAVVEQMVRRRTRGAVVNISSISATGNEGQVAYSAAKAGVNAMTSALAKELGRWSIRCNAVAPGFIGTDSTRRALSEATLKHIQANTPLRRLGEPVDVARAVASAIENDFMNGAVLQVDGGLTL
ncbi:SDR family NAD(P)-dependent oxidoreductase [Ramlibacter algicola]|uniref:SDR family oxidoreductase n=1 Tax=Ramlibacter algicola TaxID=2795217 RepID=A0A934PWT5_9BURK|nr:SDR family NAD(P)-dependent oxidoreductase [Ramlibacter algicola]MBK0391939.1 SDR family oxidoreductase [Ramlibacter algicola]